MSLINSTFNLSPDESAEFLKLILESITSAIMLIDSDMRVHRINDSFEVLFQKKSDQVLGQLCGNALGCIFAIREDKDCQNTSNCSICPLRIAAQTGFLKKDSVSKQIFTRDFQISEIPVTRHFLFSSKPLSFKNKSFVVLIIDDVTESESKKILLEQLNESRNNLLGMAVHDLRNNVTSISCCSSYLVDENPENLSEDQLSMLKMICETSGFMSEVLSEMLDLSKVEQGLLRLKPVRSDLKLLIEERVMVYKILASKKDIFLDSVFETRTSSEINFDRNYLTQVIDNLLSNALKYSYPDSSISIILREECENLGLIVEVRDQGTGIPPSEQNQLFSVYHKTSARPTSGEKSHGIGLAISRKIIEAHGGRMWVKSSPAVGSSFYFFLPFQ